MQSCECPKEDHVKDASYFLSTVNFPLQLSLSICKVSLKDLMLEVNNFITLLSYTMLLRANVENTDRAVENAAQHF